MINVKIDRLTGKLFDLGNDNSGGSGSGGNSCAEKKHWFRVVSIRNVGKIQLSKMKTVTGGVMKLAYSGNLKTIAVTLDVDADADVSGLFIVPRICFGAARQINNKKNSRHSFGWKRMRGGYISRNLIEQGFVQLPNTGSFDAATSAPYGLQDIPLENGVNTYYFAPIISISQESILHNNISFIACRKYNNGFMSNKKIHITHENGFFRPAIIPVRFTIERRKFSVHNRWDICVAPVGYYPMRYTGKEDGGIINIR
jgi:hypothetical protein